MVRRTRKRAKLITKFTLITRRNFNEISLLTRSALGAAGDVDAGGDDVRILAAVRQVPAQRHLVKVARHVDAVLVQPAKRTKHQSVLSRLTFVRRLA